MAGSSETPGSAIGIVAYMSPEQVWGRLPYYPLLDRGKDKFKEIFKLIFANSYARFRIASASSKSETAEHK
jgi:hypothetical protein